MERTIVKPWEIAVPIAITIGAYSLLTGTLTSWKISEHDGVNFTFNMQRDDISTLPV